MTKRDRDYFPSPDKECCMNQNKDIKENESSEIFKV